MNIHARKMNLMRGIDLKKVAEKINGASGAELKVLISVLIVSHGFLRKSGFVCTF